MKTEPTNDSNPVEEKEEKLVNVDELLDILWTEQSRPSSRWLRDRTDSNEIPCVSLGGRIFYSVEAVREALLRKPKYRASEKFSDSKDKQREDFVHNTAELQRLNFAHDMKV